MMKKTPRPDETRGRGEERDDPDSGEQNGTAHFCFVYMSAWFAVCAICMSIMGTSATRQQMRRIPVQIARTETINLILPNMKNPSLR